LTGAKARQPANQSKENFMLYTIALVLVILWLLGLVTGTTMGGLIHILLVIAIIVVLLRVISGRKPL
jgi:tryptophan-rich sensory protein